MPRRSLGRGTTWFPQALNETRTRGKSRPLLDPVARTEWVALDKGDFQAFLTAEITHRGIQSETWFRKVVHSDDHGTRAFTVRRPEGDFVGFSVPDMLRHDRPIPLTGGLQTLNMELL